MRIEYIKTNKTIFQVADVFREIAADVFESFGKHYRNTTIETFHDFGRLDANSTKTGIYSFRNENLFYWIFIKGRHFENPDQSANLYLEFESQVKNADKSIFQVFAEYADYGNDVLHNEQKPLENVKIEFEENYTSETKNLLNKLREIL